MLTSILILSGIAAALALLIELSHSWIANYGESSININEEKMLTVQGGASLLSSLQDQGIFIPSACGGKGTCAYCKVRVLEGGGPVLETETPYLDQREIDSDVRLSCQVKVRNDLRIEIPEEFFQIKEFRMRTERIQTLTPFISGFIFRIIEPEGGISFKPGQYIELEIPPAKRSQEGEYRAYSMASSPQEPDHIELFVAKMDKGLVSTYLHDSLKAGDELTIRGPFGDFFYHEGENDLLMIATGSGLAPIISILRHLKSINSRRRVIFFFGNRRPEDIYCRKELQEIKESLADFNCTLILSRTTDEDDWTGKKGRVTDLIKEDIPEGADLDVYICGSSAMVEDSFRLLKEKGISVKHIHFDKFD